VYRPKLDAPRSDSNGLRTSAVAFARDDVEREHRCNHVERSEASLVFISAEK
jgi:hypothetical protein